MAIQIRELIIAVFLAVFLWYGITGSEKIESYIDVRLDYSGLPPGMVITDGPTNKVSVRVRASEGVLRSTTDREHMLVLDLSSVVKGDNLILVPVDRIKLPTGVEIMEVSPSRIQLTADALVEKTIPVILHVSKKVSSDYTVRVKAEPAEVTVRGGSEHINEIQETILDVILEGPLAEGVTANKRVVSVAENVDVTPSTVSIVQTVEVNRKEVVMTLPVTMPDADNPVAYTPAAVKVTVEAPLSMADVKTLAKRSSARVERTVFGSRGTRKVVVDLPDLVKLVKIEPESVDITANPASEQ